METIKDQNTILKFKRTVHSKYFAFIMDKTFFNLLYVVRVVWTFSLDIDFADLY